MLAGAIASFSRVPCTYSSSTGRLPSQPQAAHLPPFGLIFAAFMVASMGGSSLFAILSAKMRCERILSYVFVCGAISLSLPLFFKSTLMTLVAFLLFEACVGMYWPSIGTVKSQIVPEESRATIYNIYRVPLNAIVLGVLLNHISTLTALTCCSVMLALAFVCQRTLIARMATGRDLLGASGDRERGRVRGGCTDGGRRQRLLRSAPGVRCTRDALSRTQTVSMMSACENVKT